MKIKIKLFTSHLFFVSLAAHAQPLMPAGVSLPVAPAPISREVNTSMPNAVKPNLPAINSAPARLTTSDNPENVKLNDGGRESEDNWLYPKSMTSSGGGRESEDNWLYPKSMTSSAYDARGQALETSNIDVPVVLTNGIRTNRAYDDSSPRTKAQQVGSNPLLVPPPSPSAPDAKEAVK